MISTSLFRLILISSVGLVIAVINGKETGSIVNSGGRSIITNRGKFPFVVRVHIKSTLGEAKCDLNYNCGGIILTSEIILTTAHCFDEPNQKVMEMYIVAGAVHLEIEKNSKQSEFVIGFKVHEKYKEHRNHMITRDEFQSYDLAILWLKNPLIFNPLTQKALLPRYDSKIDQKIGMAVGWGLTETGYSSPILKQIEMQGITNAECQKYFKYSINKYHFCILPVDSSSSPSTGDSGGPFIFDDIVLGLLSFCTTERKKRCDGKIIYHCMLGKPLVLTKLFMFSEWIKKSIKKGPPTKKCSNYGKYCAL